MRISLLLQREPFGQILEKTLARFWQARYGLSYEVSWYNSRLSLPAIQQQGRQAWLCNIYLNAIFAPGANPAIFDPIRREFARSVVPWRRPVQQAYVNLAASRYGAPWLAQAGVGVTPAIPDSAHKLIVAGNHKLRLLDYRAGLAYGLLKAGFKPEFIQREVDTRRQAAQLGLPVPELVDVADDGSWFSERYVSGTPLNRLADPKAAREATVNAANALNRLLRQTAQEESLDAYVACLYSRIRALLDSNHLLSAPQKQALRDSTEALIKQISGQQSVGGGRLTTALTHGDFQPANILVNGAEVWLIDWEYSARRQISYDVLVFTLHSRFPHNLASRLHEFVTAGFDKTGAIHQLGWPGINWPEAKQRNFYTALFLLEELQLHLEENSNSLFTQPGAGLLTLTKELARFP